MGEDLFGAALSPRGRVRDHADLTIIHGNGRSPQEKLRRVADLTADPKMPGPIFMNEHDNGRESTMANLTAEIASADSVWRSGGSWGYMPWRQGPGEGSRKKRATKKSVR